jgi:hypothetical protein
LLVASSWLLVGEVPGLLELSCVRTFVCHPLGICFLLFQAWMAEVEKQISPLRYEMTKVGAETAVVSG